MVLLLLGAMAVVLMLLSVFLVRFLPVQETMIVQSNMAWISNGIVAIVLLYLLSSQLVLAFQVAALAVLAPVPAVLFYLITLYCNNQMISLNVKMIGKYALLLALFFAFERAFDFLLDELRPTIFGDGIYTSSTMYLLIPTALWFVLNIITAFIIQQDKARLNIETKYVYIATILYRPIGVVAFLLYAIKTSNEIEIEGGEDILDLPLLRR